MDTFEETPQQRQADPGLSLRKEKRDNHFRNRSRLSLIANILYVADKGITRTHLIHKANLSHRMLESYLSYLLDKRLIEMGRSQNAERVYFKTTDRGRKYLQTYTALSELAGGLSNFPAFAAVAEVEHDRYSVL
jgi:predicted transcriptional regulator